MENKAKIIDGILKDFLKGEAKATDMRILSIRHFLAALNEAVEKYLMENNDNESKEDRERLINMINDMADIYRREISDLLVKRGKLCCYTELFNSEQRKEKNNFIAEDNSNSPSSYLN